ncbi:radical SAM protein [Candidatus Woesearchaeota archaeon]|nr:radical SAM protein [Candidatus Woesearchaeota archaeon]
MLKLSEIDPANTKVMDDYSVICKILPTNICNYKCSFCYTPGRTEELPLKHKLYNIKEKYKNLLLGKKNMKEVGIDNLSSGLKSFPEDTLVSISGGEPFIFPKFVELCKLITRKHDIRIATNLSHKNVYKFAEEIDAKKVYLIIGGFHIAEAEKFGNVDSFISNVQHLKRKGFAVSVVCVMYPETFERFSKYHKLFKSNNIDLLPRIYDGFYKMKKYPESYTEIEREFIKKYSKHYSKQIEEQNTFFQNNNFQGQNCLAGKAMVFIYPDGNAYRCSDDKMYLGHIGKGNIKLLKKAKKCRVSKCSCPSWGRRLKED